MPVQALVNVENGPAKGQIEKAVSQNGLTFPVIVKPVRGRGSAGVKVVGSVAEAAEHIESHVGPKSDKFLIEEYLAGRELAVTVMPPGTYETADGMHNEPTHWTLPAIERTGHHGGVMPFSGVVPIQSNSKPAGDDDQLREFGRHAVRVAQLLKATAPIRIDCRADANGVIKAIDINMKPSMTGPGRPGREQMINLSAMSGGRDRLELHRNAGGDRGQRGSDPEDHAADVASAVSLRRARSLQGVRRQAVHGSPCRVGRDEPADDSQPETRGSACGSQPICGPSSLCAPSVRAQHGTIRTVSDRRSTGWAFILIVAPTRWPIPKVIAMASAPPTVTRRIGRRGFAPPSRAATQPVIASARSTAATVTAMRVDAGGRRIAMSGSSAPMVNDTADEIAASHGLVSSSGSIRSSSSAWAASGS